MNHSAMYFLVDHLGTTLTLGIGLISLLTLASRYRSGPTLVTRSHGQTTRVLFVNRDLPFHGGVPRCILYLARACERERVQVHVASLKAPSAPMRAAFAELGILAETVGDSGYTSPAMRLRDVVDSHEIDVVVGTSFKAYLIAKMACFTRRQTRCIFWVHAVHGAVNGRWRRLALKWLSRHDPMMFVSKAVARAHLLPSHQGPRSVIYNGVEDVADHPAYLPYPPSQRYEFDVPEKALVLAYIAEFVDWKDHATLIKAIEILVRKKINVHLLLMGTGELFEKTQALAKSGIAADRIHFLGARADARRILGMADIYVHPSVGEGFGLAIVEAMLASLPVVVSNTGAPIEYVDKTVGQIFESGNATDLAEKIMVLGRDLPKARQAGMAGRRRALDKFGIEPFADEICNFIESSLFLPYSRGARRPEVSAVHHECADLAQCAGVEDGITPCPAINPEEGIAELYRSSD